MKSDELITELIAQTTEITKRVERYQEYALPVLKWRSTDNSWNILECIAHLNLYGAFYLPEFDRQLSNAKIADDQFFRPGLLGNYFANSMLPKDKLNKMQTFKDKNPLGQELDLATIQLFLQQQYKLLALLEKARGISLNKTKISISISRFLKLKLGDGFRFYVNHILRHIKQMESIEEAFQNQRASF